MSKAKVELSEPISLRLPVEMLETLEKVAQASERSRSWLLVRALRRYLATEGADILAVAEGVAQIERGEHVDMDDLIAELQDADRTHKAA